MLLREESDEQSTVGLPLIYKMSLQHDLYHKFFDRNASING